MKQSELERQAKNFIISRSQTIEKIEETHISTIYLTKQFAYKRKKPLFFGFLDYRTVEKREEYCKKEVSLNQRLSNIYIGTEPIYLNGEIIDWLVVMRRLKENQMLESYLKTGLPDELIDSFIEKFYRFSLQKRSPEIDRFGDISVIESNWNENFQQTEDQIGSTISREQFSKIKESVEKFCSKKELFKERVDMGAIIDGHGDIRIEHIYFEKDQAYLFDCIEFNDRFRYQDRLLDFAFLLMDLEYNGYGEISTIMFGKYCKRFNEKGVDNLCDFYKCYRAYVRGKVEGFMYKEGKNEKNLKRAIDYFRLSEQYADRF